MKRHHTPNIRQGKISLKTRQIRRIRPGHGSVRNLNACLSLAVVRSLSVRRYD
jgi:hypothetical protein